MSNQTVYGCFIFVRLVHLPATFVNVFTCGLFNMHEFKLISSGHVEAPVAVDSNKGIWRKMVTWGSKLGKYGFTPNFDEFKVFRFLPLLNDKRCDSREFISGH